MIGFVTLVCTLGSEAILSGALSASFRGDKSVKDLICRRPARRLRRNLNLVRIFLGRSVLHRQAWDFLGTWIAVMARVAGHDLASPKAGFVDGVHHLNHRSRHAFARNI